MSVTIDSVLDELRAVSTSEADKGDRFERLMKAYLTTDPVYAEQFSDVWRWQEWPGNGQRHDTGIDLVAQDRSTGGLVAIQCKFYAPTTMVGKPDIDSFLAASGTTDFDERMIISTTDRWNGHAEATIAAQDKKVRRVGLPDLAASRVDWGKYSPTTPEVMYLGHRKQPRQHQREAIDAVTTGLDGSDRGRLIMACGTGKTFTALRLAEQMVGAGGSALFLVPSISLPAQSIREWVGEAEVDLQPFAVCSDPKATRASTSTSEDISSVDLALPATTDADLLAARMDGAASSEAMTVVFATYQSIDVVARTQQARGGRFDLVVCDEAHRTTGITLAKPGTASGRDDESAFVRVHDDGYLPAAKRLYMTATPRLYTDDSKTKAVQSDAVLCSMDDESLYGPELHRLGFGEAVDRDLLTDYKVLVLAVDEASVARTFQQQLSSSEIGLDDVAKIVGCWNGLAKRGLAEHEFAPDAAPMRRAVAFSGTIADSKRVEELFTQISSHYVEESGQLDGDGELPLACEVKHVDGTFNALERSRRIDWLKGDPGDRRCDILTNARCLSEGVDVPALDAVMFLAPRRSPVDIVQSVGRVMRKAPGKQFGYIILPVGIPAGVSAEKALQDNKRYAVVWEVLRALRAHDERFNAMVNRIDLTAARDKKINVIGVTGGEEPDEGGGDTGATDGGEQTAIALAWDDIDELRDAVYSRIVAKVGTRAYWTRWASDVADIAERQITRITALLDDPSARVDAAFTIFLDGLRGNLNEGISRADAVEMLAQHLITRPVFDALFEGYDVMDHNPVAQTMERMLVALDEHGVHDENSTLEKFYDSVRLRVQGVDSAEARQHIILELYNTFFAKAFKKTVDRLGIVYTPVEVVDFVLRSADQVLRREFDRGLTDEGVHVLDGFVGTGTFITRLIASGLVRPEDLVRKYANERHANEILLLAYYIAAINIESTYQDAMRQAVDPDHGYEPFPGLVLTDTFQSWEGSDRQDLDVFPENNDRLARLKRLPVTVIVGNPPYSVGQESANDANQNEQYPSLDAAIKASYVDTSGASLSRNMYDSYVRAIRWASDCVADRGLVAMVTNGGYLEQNNADGMRKALVDEFAAIHVVNLRGNQRTSGERSRKEGGKIFDAGSRATIAITVLVKNAARSGPATICYTDIGDYLSREQKLAKLVEGGGVLTLDGAVAIEPDGHGDWLSHRSADFGAFAPVSEKKSRDSIFLATGPGLLTNRDAWAHNFSQSSLRTEVQSTISTYNDDSRRLRAADLKALNQRELQEQVTVDPSLIAWTDGLRNRLRRGLDLEYSPSSLRSALYRPFQRTHLYLNDALVERPSRTSLRFPDGRSQRGIFIAGPSSSGGFGALMVDNPSDLHLLGSGHVLDRWRFVEAGDGMLDLSGGAADEGLVAVDNVTDTTLDRFRAAYGPQFTKDDVFSYVYGLLHSPDYRQQFAADLEKMLPRIPLVEDAAAFVDAGVRLSALHLGYERQEPYPLAGLSVGPSGGAGYDFFRVEKMRFGRPTPEQKAGGERQDRSTIVYNSRVTLSGIPQEAYRYRLGSKSAIEWVMDRYRVTTDKASGIVNDPNDWSREVGDPRYVVDLLARIVTVSLATMAIVEALPDLAVRADQLTGRA